MDLLRNPDVSYADHSPPIKYLKRGFDLERLVRNPFVVLVPNVQDEKYSAYLLRHGIDTKTKMEPFLDGLVRRMDSDTAVVFSPLVRSSLSALPVTNLTVVPECRHQMVAHAASVPWITFRSVSVDKRNSLGAKRIRGRLYNFVIFSDEDWDFFPENSVFDLTRPFPFAFAPPPPAIPEPETTSSTPPPEVTESLPVVEAENVTSSEA